MRRLWTASVPVLAWACGGSIGPVEPGALHLEGSYDLLVASLDVTATQPGYQPPTTTHPAAGHHARLDIRKNGSGYDAAVTPDFGQSAAMTVSFGQDGTATLTGNVYFEDGTSSYASVDDELDAIHLGVGSDGKWSGSFTAEGTETTLDGDVGYQSDAAATGTITSDARAPEVRASAIASAATVVLPWDALDVETSEPVDGAALTSALSLTPGSVAWQPATPGVAWLGPMSIVGYRTIWSDFSGNTTLGVAGGLVDPSGNASSSVATTLQFLAVPFAPAFSGSTAPAMWGAASVVTSAESCGTAASCFEIGPLQGPCGAAPGGIAGRLPSGSNVSITYRVRVATELGPPMLGALGLRLVTPGPPGPASNDVQVTTSPSDDPTYDYASDWTTVEAAAPQGASEIGFSLVPYEEMATYCGGGPAVPPMTVVVDVAEIKVVP